MAKFIDKKERVYDLKLTSYGHYLFSVGQFNPVYYAFYDSNVIYDGAYVGITESQSEIQQRIKHETQYLEGLVLFEEIEDQGKLRVKTDGEWDSDGTGDPETYDSDGKYFSVDVTPTMIQPRKDTFRYTDAIGDSFLDGEQQMAPAWKIVSLDGKIAGSTAQDTKNDVHIPQINITLNYKKQIENYDPTRIYTEEDLRNSIAETDIFADDKIIRFVSDDLMLYIEEQNTDMLSENCDVEVFEVDLDAFTVSGSAGDADDRFKDVLHRRYFAQDLERIQGGLMTDAAQGYNDPIESDNRNIDFEYTTSSVGYYFDIYRDHQIDAAEACKASAIFNKQSYYIDLDFDCETTAKKNARFIDIYGPVTEPEICP